MSDYQLTGGSNPGEHPHRAELEALADATCPLDAWQPDDAEVTVTDVQWRDLRDEGYAFRRVTIEIEVASGGLFGLANELATLSEQVDGMLVHLVAQENAKKAKGAA